MFKSLLPFLIPIILYSCTEINTSENRTKQAILSATDNRITFETIDHTVRIYQGQGNIDIQGSGLSPVYVDGRGPDSLVMVDYNLDGKFTLLMLIDDFNGTGATHLMGIRLEPGNEEPVLFKTPVDVNETLEVKSHILIIQGNEYLYACSSDTVKFKQRLIKIDKYKWSKEKKYYNFLGSKVFDSIPANKEDFKF